MIKNEIIDQKTLIINYSCLKIGGIECYFADLIRYAIKKDYRVIWLTTVKNIQEADFQDIVNSNRVEKIIVGQGRHIFDDFQITLNNDENVILLSCEPISFVAGEKIKEKCNIKNFNNFLVLPHFTGNAYYPERYFEKVLLEKFFFKLFQNMASKIINNNALLAFSEKHLTAYEENYRIKILNKENKVLKALLINESVLSEVDLENKAKNRKNNFEIITCARFDFPHKGYIIGLVKAFNNLKFVYPQLTLTIVGYGEGEQYLKEIINELPDYSKKDINLLGKLLPHELQKAFCKATLNVGLAGALNVGARCALPSIPVRHYTYDCECYGFYENSGESALSIKPGDNIEDYISETVNCSDKEYVLHGLSAYKKANNNNNVDPEYIFKQHNRSNLPIFSKFDFLKFNFINFMICIMRKIFKIKSYNDTNGT
mgnify:FL=1